MEVNDETVSLGGSEAGPLCRHPFRQVVNHRAVAHVATVKRCTNGVGNLVALHSST